MENYKLKEYIQNFESINKNGKKTVVKFGDI